MKRRQIKKLAKILHLSGDADYVWFCYNKLRQHFFYISEPSGRHYLDLAKVVNYYDC